MFEHRKFEITYYSGQNFKTKLFNNNFSNEDFRAVISFETDSLYKKLILEICPHKEIRIEDLRMTIEFSYNSNQRVYVNGYQSWTDSREFFIDEKINGISRFAAPIMKKYQFDKYGDYSFKKYTKKSGEFHGFTYSYIREKENFKLIGSLSERNGYTIIEHFTKKDKIVINKECKGLHIKEKYTAYELVWIEGSEDEVFDSYFNLMNINKLRCKAMTGWTSWYNYYQDINEEIILENLNNFKAYDKTIDIFQIDDGYQTAVGDWLSIDSGKFPRGMKYIADSIKEKGYKAGIWLAPFACETNSEIYKNKKHWILKDKNGELVMAGSNWSGFYALDIHNLEVKQYIKNVFKVILEDWGYDLVKLDFLYAVCLVPTKYKTRGQIMCEAMEFLRECVGDKLILGCGVPLGPSFGLVDYCRIGCDVGLDWDDKFFMRFLHRERISTLNAITNSIGRRHLDGRAFLNDPDVFLLREDNMGLTEVQRKTLSAVNSIFGSLIFTSDNINKYDEKKHSLFDNIMNLEEKKIHKVEWHRKGLVEAYYSSGGKEYILLVNLTGWKINYQSEVTTIKEVFLDRKETVEVSGSKLELQPYETRLFSV
ncbi:glycoside hydrolase family 36 protein [Clostridium thermarum]|uniref:glycoside hydrolase family 36 protein n=1 Tax=Clostridium thermarum TaxID=1716543 RepID=UPI0013D293F2|nr:glycoside hydrolase family 36 protein [Clostridium thermarum]